MVDKDSDPKWVVRGTRDGKMEAEMEGETEDKGCKLELSPSGKRKFRITNREGPDSTCRALIRKVENYLSNGHR